MLLRLSPLIVLIALGGPIILGLAFTALPAFGFFPAIGGHTLSLQGWRDLAAFPGFFTALRLTLTTGITATLISLVIAVSFCALTAQNASLNRFRHWLAPLLAAPHSAIALGFAFLVAPSGWILRLLSPWATGYDRPPTDIITIQDPLGLALVAGLLLKEVPYLILMILAATSQVAVAPTLATARALGQRPAIAWIKTVFPQVYPQIRLPVFAVLAFSLSVVDMALILGPGTAPPLAVLAVRWFANFNLTLYYPAAAAAMLQLVLVALCITLWRLMESPVSRLALRWIEHGGSNRLGGNLVSVAGWLAVLLGVLGIVSLIGMSLWAFAGIWRFPDALPTNWRISQFETLVQNVLAPASTTVFIAITTVILALLLALGCLENEQRQGLHPGKAIVWMLYVPLLAPQIGFLFGVQVLLIRLNLDGTLLAVIWIHTIFVMPYVFLSLADPFRSLDPRYIAGAAALGASPLRIFLAIKLPLLTRPLLAAAAVGFAVSVSLYLPTLFAGSGRVVTLTTEAVTLSDGADRRITGMLVLFQSALPLAAYALALSIPAILFANRRGLAR
ncbi:MAG: ABC transporter permease [Beijerinckiaceae bacterium]